MSDNKLQGVLWIFRTTGKLSRMRVMALRFFPLVFRAVASIQTEVDFTRSCAGLSGFCVVFGSTGFLWLVLLF